METPKTRTLRKRENAEADIGGIEWVCDKTLIYQIKAATRERELLHLLSLSYLSYTAHQSLRHSFA